MDEFLFVILLLKVLLVITLLAIFFGLIVPRALVQYKIWRSKASVTAFSSLFMYSFISLLLFSVIFISAVHATMKLEKYFSNGFGYEQSIIFILSFLLLGGFLIPRTILSFRKWKISQRNLHFSLTIIYGAISLYFMTSLYALAVPLAWR